MRAVLFANATITSIGGLRASILASQEPAGAPLRLAQRTTPEQAMIKSRRKVRSGLYFSLQVDPTTPEGQTALGTVGRQDIKGCSFGFRVRAESWDDGGDRLPLRTITDVDLY
jgi:hypothetical protein